MNSWSDTLIHQMSYTLTFMAFSLAWGYRSQGKQQIPRSGPCLLVSNHDSFLDPIFIGLSAPRPLCYLARDNLFRHPIGAALIRKYGAVPIDRSYGRAGLETVLECLGQGKAVVMFPEGERSRDGEIQELKSGLSLLIKKANVPIIPCGIAGSFEVWSRHEKTPRLSPLFLPDRGASVAVVVGKPLLPEVFTGWDRTEMLSFVREKIVDCKKQAQKLRRKS